jgi:hypothetical protein
LTENFSARASRKITFKNKEKIVKDESKDYFSRMSLRGLGFGGKLEV